MHKKNPLLRLQNKPIGQCCTEPPFKAHTFTAGGFDAACTTAPLPATVPLPAHHPGCVACFASTTPLTPPALHATASCDGCAADLQPSALQCCIWRSSHCCLCLLLTSTPSPCTGYRPCSRNSAALRAKLPVALRAAAATASLVLILKPFCGCRLPPCCCPHTNRCCCGCCCLSEASLPRPYLDNASTCCLCELQSTHTQLGHLEQAGVVCDSGHDDCDLVLLQAPKPAAAAASAPKPRLLGPLIHSPPPAGSCRPPPCRS